MPPDATRPPGARRAAVVANPTKHDDIENLKDAVCAAMPEHGWDQPLWFETTAADPDAGHAEGVAGSGVPLGTLPLGTLPLGTLPLGTGNLLARNLGLPLDPGAALTTALTGTDRRPPGENQPDTRSSAVPALPACRGRVPR